MPNSAPEILIFPTRAALAQNAAERFVALARAAIAARGRFAVALSGGSTPRELYARLATPALSAQIDWARVHLFWGDERAVPPDDPDSNFKMAYDTLIAHVPIPAANVNRILAEQMPEHAATTYARTLKRFFSATPEFDLILLGLGADGHTASLFPQSAGLHEGARWVIAHHVETLRAWRITLTAPTINAARHILFLVAGADKANAARDVLRGAPRPDDLPAQMIQPENGECVWLLDQGAASELESPVTRFGRAR
ncbi:MAG: 6-phosphogluconolactonase [Chloroflexi bacterium]|nr:6-phosphogluconolactonase [Chloroflexota bacterium]